MPWAQVLLEHLAGWVHSVPREQLEPLESLVLEELAVQPVLRVQRVCLVLRELPAPRRTGWGR